MRTKIQKNFYFYKKSRIFAKTMIDPPFGRLIAVQLNLLSICHSSDSFRTLGQKRPQLLP